MNTERPYPMRNDRPINPMELGLEIVGKPHDPEFNNHHLYYQAQKFGRILLYKTLRDLNSNQLIMPVSLHTDLHRHYTYVPFPSPETALDDVVEAYETDQPLQIGSSTSPIYQTISMGRMGRIMRDYKDLR